MCSAKIRVAKSIGKMGSTNSALEVYRRSHECSCVGISTWRGEDKINEFGGFNTVWSEGWAQKVGDSSILSGTCICFELTLALSSEYTRLTF